MNIRRSDYIPDAMESMQKIPISFETTPVKVFSLKNKGMIVVISAFIWVLFLILSFIFFRTLLVFVFLGIMLVGGILGFRFILYKEGIYKKVFKHLKSNDNVFANSSLWGVFSTDDAYPYVSYMQNGLKMVVVQFNADTVVGKPDTLSFDNGQAIGEAIGFAAKRCSRIVGIDLMHSIGKDERLEQAFTIADTVPNKVQRDTLMQLYGHAQKVSNSVIQSKDVYAFYFVSGIEVLKDDLGFILQKFMDANYSSYTVLDSNEKARVYRSLTGLNGFTLVDKMSQTGAITPIMLYNDGETTVLNRTSRERKELERVYKAEKKVKAKKKWFKRSKDDDDTIDF